MKAKRAAVALLVLSAFLFVAAPDGGAVVRRRHSIYDWTPRGLHPLISELRGDRSPPPRAPHPAGSPAQDAQQTEPAPGAAAPPAQADDGASASAAEAERAEPEAAAPAEPGAEAPAPPTQSHVARKSLGALVLAALVALPLWLRRRRRGDLAVVIDTPPSFSASFQVRLRRTPQPLPAPRPAKPLAATSAPTSTRTERFLVTREAQFTGLAPGRYWVVVEGELRDAAAGRALPCFLQRTARVEVGRTLRLDFAFPLEGAQLLADTGRFDEALSVLDAARQREPELPHLATRIEELRKRIDAQRTAPTVPRAGARAGTESRYEILGEVGRGGMAIVYRARDTRLDRIVALKRISESLREHPRAVELLQREARSAARLNHPNIVTVYDVDEEAGSYFITMEFLEGTPLHAVLRSRGRLAPRAVAGLGQQVAAGLAYAHEQRVVHRDVKTANLFVTRERALKIMDFGLAKMVEEVRRRATLIGGTPSYMAPEQAAGVEVDGRADLYALGVTLFELSTGTLPFEEGDLARHHRETPPPDPRGRVEGIPDALAELILQLLAKRPEERPASPEVAARLRAIAQAAR